jgi:hypothetical protein
MGQFSFATSNALPLVALLCFASVLFLAVCVAKYFRSRNEEVLSVADAVPVPQQVELHPTLELVRLDDAIEASIDKVMQTWGGPPLASSEHAYPCGDEDQRQSTPGEAPTPACEITDLRDALTARVASDRDSAHGLKELVRALYLDQSNFRFHEIAELQAEDRVLARALIEQWMSNPTAVEYWEQTYAAVCESPAALRADRA